MTEARPPRMAPHPSTVAKPAAVLPVRVRTGGLATYPPGTAPPRPPAPPTPAPSTPSATPRAPRPAGYAPADHAAKPSHFSGQSQAFLVAHAAKVATANTAARKPDRRLYDIDADSKLGPFPVHGYRGTVKIPEVIFSADTRISADAWKLACYLLSRATLGIKERMPTRIPTADAQRFFGGRNTLARVKRAFHELRDSSRWQFTPHAPTDYGILSDTASWITNVDMQFAFAVHVYYPAPEYAGDTSYVQENRYAIVNLKQLRLLNNVKHLRFFLFWCHTLGLAKRNKNNERWLVVGEVSTLAGVRKPMKWGNIEQNYLRPAIAAFKKVTGEDIHIDLRCAKTLGSPVTHVKFTIGSRFKSYTHMSNAASERRDRKFLKDEAAFKLKLDAAVEAMKRDDRFLGAAQVLREPDMYADPLEKEISRVYHLRLHEWRSHYSRDTKAACSVTFDGELQDAVLARLQASLDYYVKDKAEQELEYAEDEAKSVREETEEAERAAMAAKIIDEAFAAAAQRDREEATQAAVDICADAESAAIDEEYDDPEDILDF
jgi:hypothetical protein